MLGSFINQNVCRWFDQMICWEDDGLQNKEVLKAKQETKQMKY